MTRFRAWRLAAVIVAAGLAAAGCTVNPATGKEEFTPFMTPAQEIEVGRKEHPKLLAAFGGAYEERPALSRYVAGIGERIKRATETPDTPFTFTVVNSDIVNAFALPGGYVYVSRGLLALANSEAELAGVIAHETGHVTGRHTAKRYSRGVLAQLGAAIAGVATGNRMIGQLANLGAAAYVQGYSRSQELEADTLGVGYLARAGYDPEAMASFLEVLGAESALARKIAGREGADPAASLFSSHPRTARRVVEAARAARGRGNGHPFIGHDAYLLHLDGTLYGDDPDQGIRRGREFIHPGLRFRFEVPPGFRMQNTSKAVLASHRNGAAIRFDGARAVAGLSMTEYLTGLWLKDVPLRQVEALTVNGMAAATGTARANTRQGQRDVRAIVIRYDRTHLYRFLVITPPQITASMSEDLRRMTYSFRALSEAEARAVKPLRIRIHEVAAGETVDSLAARLPFDDFRVERFRVLNGLKPNEALRPGRLVKLIE
ncbi:MAG: M48 family metalloprotease [Alphaproteobacteria bacterium]